MLNMYVKKYFLIDEKQYKAFDIFSSVNKYTFKLSVTKWCCDLTGQDRQLKTNRTITKFQNEWVRKMFHDMELYP